MNWTHSGGILSALGFVWLTAALLVVLGASADVWLAGGMAVGSLAVANSLRREHRVHPPVSRRFRTLSYVRSRRSSNSTVTSQS